MVLDIWCWYFALEILPYFAGAPESVLEGLIMHGHTVHEWRQMLCG